MRLLLWGLAAAALLVTEPGKRLQRKAVDTFKELKGKACGAKTQEGNEKEGEKGESVNVGANGKPTKDEKAAQDGKQSQQEKSSKKDGKPSKDEAETDSESERQSGKRKLRAVSNEETEKGEAENHETENDQAELEASRVAMKDSIERHPEMGAEENEDDMEEPRLEEEAEDEETNDEESGDAKEQGIDEKKGR